MMNGDDDRCYEEEEGEFADGAWEGHARGWGDDEGGDGESEEEGG